jgi:ribonuclease HI
MIIAFFDGATEPINPGGSMGIGAIIFRATNPEIIPLNGTVFFKREENWEQLYEHAECIHPGERGFKMTSNNVAEYIAFTKVVEYLISNEIKETVYILGDSKLVVEQMVGSWRMKGGIYIKFAKKAQQLFTDYYAMNRNVNLHWISRDNNIADEVSKRDMIKRGVKFKIQPL